MVKKITKKSNTKIKKRVRTSPKIKSIVNIEVKNDSKKDKRIIFAWSVCIIVLVVVLLGFFTYKYFIKPNNYLIQNNYYGFSVKTPAGWRGEEKTTYSEDNVSQILSKCKKDKTSIADNYEIGAFRFMDAKYIGDIGDPWYLTTGMPSGVVLEVVINCVPDRVRGKSVNYNSKLKVAGENAIENDGISSEYGEIRQISFWHNNFQYQIKEYLHASIKDQKTEEFFKEKYTEIFDNIVSSFKITK